MAKGNKLIDNRVQISVNLVRYKSHGQVFEVAINPDKSVEYKQGKKIDIDEIIEAEDIFNDMKKGLFASTEDLQRVFGTTDALRIAKIMLDKGEIQFTQKYRQEMQEKKRNKIVNIIHRTVVNPKTSLPHPINRIENAMEEARIKIEDNESAEKQVKKIIQALQPIIPMSIEENTYTVHASVHYAGKVQSILREFGTIVKEQWLSDGGGMFNVKVSAGRSQDLISQLNNQTHASVNIEKINMHKNK